MRWRQSVHLWFLLGLVLDIGFGPRIAQGQATATAQRSAGIFVFAGYNRTTPDYGTPANNGITFGADYTRHFRFSFVPALEFRANLTNGPQVKENSFLGGLRVHHTLRTRFNAYGDFLAGVGHITYPTYFPSAGRYEDLNDSGRVFSVGGGVDIGLTPHFMAKIDYQHQDWNLGANSHTMPNGGDFVLTPSVWTFGVVYRIPFRPWTDARHEPQ